jgi:hypothetical protein
LYGIALKKGKNFFAFTFGLSYATIATTKRQIGEILNSIKSYVVIIKTVGSIIDFALIILRFCGIDKI